MPTLVDTSVWISHFKKKDPLLTQLLISKQVLMHASVFGELVAGSIKNRSKVISDLKLIPMLPFVPAEEVFDLIETTRLHGKGLGWVDFQILASCLKETATLYTHDKLLKKTYTALIVK